MCGGIAEVNEEPIAEILGQVALMALNHLRTGLLILLHDRTIVFGIELRREGCRTHEVTEQNSKLAALGFCSRRGERLRGRS
jgi:hypothetical protein